MSDFKAHTYSAYINKISLFTDERPIKVTSVTNPIATKCLKFASSLESSLTQWIKCIYRELRNVPSLSQKFSWWTKVATNRIYFSIIIFPLTFYKSVVNTNAKEQALLMDQDRGKPWIPFIWYYWRFVNMIHLRS